MAKEIFTATQEVIEQIKETYPNLRLFKNNVAGDDYIFRLLTNQDWVSILDWMNTNPNVKQSDLDDRIVDTCVLWPRFEGPEAVIRKATQAAGVIPTLSILIRQKSGFIIPDVAGQQFSVEELGGGAVPVEPTSDEIDKLKAAYKYKLYKVTIEGHIVIYRPVNRQEWQTILKTQDDDTDFATCSKCIVWPKKLDLNNLPAGVPRTVAGLIVECSGFNLESPVEEL